ncbi:MAG: hypothetical protein WCK47_13120 [bacterium]
MSDIMPLTMIVMGVNDHLRCGVGWHDRAYDGRNGVCFRWTGARADFCLEVPRRASALRFMVSGPALLTGRPVPLSLYAPGRLLCHLPAAAPSDFWTIAEMTLKTLELAEDNAPAQFTIRCETFPGTRALSAPFVPDRYLRNSDFRRLGIMVAAIRAV